MYQGIIFDYIVWDPPIRLPFLRGAGLPDYRDYTACYLLLLKTFLKYYSPKAYNYNLYCPVLTLQYVSLCMVTCLVSHAYQNQL